jgi:hypothetical protein
MPAARESEVPIFAANARVPAVLWAEEALRRGWASVGQEADAALSSPAPATGHLQATPAVLSFLLGACLA